eukprot:182074-Rhodomonas_salina.3
MKQLLFHTVLKTAAASSASPHHRRRCILGSRRQIHPSFVPRLGDWSHGTVAGSITTATVSSAASSSSSSSSTRVLASVFSPDGTRVPGYPLMPRIYESKLKIFSDPRIPTGSETLYRYF